MKHILHSFLGLFGLCTLQAQNTQVTSYLEI
ncbi:hypothetical protein EZS27_039346, partial [termite gut metagenome]